MNPGRIYKDLWNKYLAALTVYKATGAQIAADEKSLLGYEESWLQVFDRITVDDAKKKMGEIVNQLVWQAEKTFAPPGGNLEIDSSGVREKFIDPLLPKEPSRSIYDAQEEVKEPRFEAFDPEAVWNHFEEIYGGSKGEEAANAQAAKALRELFGIKEGSPVTIKGGFTILEMHVYLDSYYKKYGKNNISHTSEEDFTKILQALAGFAAWNSDRAMRQLLTYAKTRFFRNKGVESREKMPIAVDSEIVTYHNRFEFRFGKVTGEKLQIFLGTYGEKIDSGVNDDKTGQLVNYGADLDKVVKMLEKEFPT